MNPLFWTSLVVAALMAPAAADPLMEELEGTWLLKLNTVFTGPGFYDPVDELLIEPDLPGISYLFTKDGHYEEALYRVEANPVDHQCPVGSITYQHGKYELLLNGSLVLTPIAVDGRQLLSEPCGDTPDKLKYVRYHQPTWFKTFQVYIDPYHGKKALQIFQFDGLKMQPLYLAYSPPMMLPTGTLNPTNTAEPSELGDGKKDKRLDPSLRQRVRRLLENQYRTNAVREPHAGLLKAWWAAVGVLGVSSFAFFML